MGRFYLKKNEAGFILGPGGTKALIPPMDDDEPVPENVAVVTTIMVLINHDPTFLPYLWDKWQKIISGEMKPVPGAKPEGGGET